EAAQGIGHTVAVVDPLHLPPHPDHCVVIVGPAAPDLHLWARRAHEAHPPRRAGAHPASCDRLHRPAGTRPGQRVLTWWAPTAGPSRWPAGAARPSPPRPGRRPPPAPPPPPPGRAGRASPSSR